MKKTMVQNTRVYNLIIVDASGSMQDIYRQALSGINETIRTIKNVQKKNADVAQYLTLLSFSNGGGELQYVYREEGIKRVDFVRERDYQLRDMTALYDAIGESVTELRRHIGANDKALVTIITDGYENDSREWDAMRVKGLVEELRSKGWVFTYIGANQDVVIEAEKIGVVNSMAFEATVDGTVEMFEREGRFRERWNERVCRGEEDLERDYFLDEEEEDFPRARITPERIDRLAPNEIFVFGSNWAGHHNGGAARVALRRFGAQYGKGIGIQGQSYAIPTRCMPQIMAGAIQEFIRYARRHPEMRFLVTAVGCGNAGYEPRLIAPIFRNAVDVPNICLPKSFWKILTTME